jgi:hypothetical protein
VDQPRTMATGCAAECVDQPRTMATDCAVECVDQPRSTVECWARIGSPLTLLLVGSGLRIDEASDLDQLLRCLELVGLIRRTCKYTSTIPLTGWGLHTLTAFGELTTFVDGD